MLESLRFWLLWQAWVTVFFVLIVALLRSFRSRPFFDFWMVAGSFYAVQLFLSYFSLGATRAIVKWIFLGIGLLCIAVTIWALVMAAESLRGKPRRRRRWLVLAACCAAALAVFAVSYRLRLDSNVSFAVRGIARTAPLAAAFLYNARAIGRWKPWANSVASQLIVTGCAASAAIAVIQSVVIVLIGAKARFDPSLHGVFALEIASEFLIVAGLCRLLVEKSCAFRTRLEMYETIIPVCCVCGAVRDDPPGGHGRGDWMTLLEFVAKHSPARFSHGYCPKCLRYYHMDRRKPGLVIDLHDDLDRVERRRGD